MFKRLKLSASVCSNQNANCDPDIYTSLSNAIKNGDLERTRELIDSFRTFNSSDKPDGYFLLKSAINRGHSDIAKLLLTNGSLVCINEKSANNLLHPAVNKGYIDVVEMLLDKGAEIEEKNLFGQTPLYCAVFNKNIEITNLLIDRGADIYNTNHLTLLHLAVKVECLPIVERLLNLGFCINAVANIDSGFTPLHQSVYNNHLILSSFLINKGADINSITIEGYTPLHLASMRGNQSIAECLLNHGADANAQDINGKTPIYYACINNYLNIFEIFVTNKANAEEYSNLLNTAVIYGHIDIVKALLRHVDIHARDFCNRTVLHFTAYCSESHERCDDYTRGKLAKLLLSKGANINAKTNKGETTLHGAIKNNCKKLVKILLEYGADINLKTEKNQTPWRSAHLFDSNENFGETTALFTTFYFASDSDDESPNNIRSQVIQDLRFHLIKMHKANFYVNPQDLHSIRLKTKNIHFQDKCVEEISYMKSKKIINTNISFYNILTKDSNSLEMYMRNENIVEALKSGYYKIQFPIYASMIKNNFRTSMERNNLLERSKKISHLLFKNYPQLPYICTEKIFSFLDNEDLKTLVNLE